MGFCLASKLRGDIVRFGRFVLIELRTRFSLKSLFFLHLSECKKSREGCEYMGSVAVTSSGVECQRWDEQTPHAHSFTDQDMFPDRNWNALSNKCRCTFSAPQKSLFDMKFKYLPISFLEIRIWKGRDRGVTQLILISDLTSVMLVVVKVNIAIFGKKYIGQGILCINICLLNKNIHTFQYLLNVETNANVGVTCTFLFSYIFLIRNCSSIFLSFCNLYNNCRRG